IVLAEITARGFVARGAVLDLANRVQTDECRLLPVSPQPQRLLSGADRPRFSTVFVHNDFWLLARGPETGANKIHLRLHHCKVILCSALQHKTSAQRGEVRNACYIEKDILREHSRESRQNLLRLPSLALEVDDV